MQVKDTKGAAQKKKKSMNNSKFYTTQLETNQICKWQRLKIQFLRTIGNWFLKQHIIERKLF